jgi:hypothetical protein
MDFPPRGAAFRIGLSLALLSGVAAGGAEGACVDLLKVNRNSDVAQFGGEGAKSELQEMANALVRYASRNDERQIQVAFPVKLEKNDFQPQQFGDGQQNAFASFGPLKKQPFTAVLTRARGAESSELAILISPEVLGGADLAELEFSVRGSRGSVAKGEDGAFTAKIDAAALGWNGLYGAESVYFRPKGWNDWFAVAFPQAYLPIDELVGGMDAAATRLPGGESVLDPLHLKNAPSPADALKNVDGAHDLGFQLARVDPGTRVHGVYQFPDGRTVNTAAGGIWTRYRIGAPFKEIYMVKDPRNVAVESAEGVVTGTGPHYIGANAEIILNSLGNEPLVTYYGIPIAKTGPDGAKVAWGSELGYQWIGTWLKPGQAFVSPQGTFHWHLNHLEGKPVQVQVWTPPYVPNPANQFGFPKR